MRYQKEITLRNGTTCLLKNAVPMDALEVLTVFLKTHGETDFLLTYPDESDATLESERASLAKMADSTDEAEICAIVGGRIVGTAGIGPVSRNEKARHRAVFGIAVDRAHWNMGIGRALTEACIECAFRAGYAQIELDVVADNVAAIHLYESVGFVEFGRNPKGFRSRQTGWQEVVEMRLDLEQDAIR